MCETPLLLLIIIIKKVIYRYIYRAQEGAAFRLEGQDGGGAGLIRRGLFADGNQPYLLFKAARTD